MSQKGSSVSNQNPEAKYKKALTEIQKIHNANKVLKNQSEEMKVEYERQLNDLGLSLQHLEKENDEIKNNKAQLEKYLEELQVSNTELRKQYNNLEREVSYLNDVLTEQNTELKKMNAFKDEKGLAALITSYEDREMNYRKDIARQEEVVKMLRNSCESLEADLGQERRQRYKLEDLNNGLRMEISKYRELNNSLLSKNQTIVSSLLNRSSEGREKYREAECILSELGRQLQLVKSNRAQQQAHQRTTVSLDSYESLLQEKNRMEGEIHRIRQKFQQSENKSKQIFAMEEKMKRATLRSEQLHEECNMLKSKLVIVQTKEIMQSWQNSGLNQYEQRVIANIGQNDPLPAIKNSSDSSHFQLMKTYIVQLKQKLSKALLEKKEYEKKYRSLKEKVGQKAEKAMGLQEQNKLIRGKLQGFQRLTERLQFEMQRNIESHEEEMNKMKSITNNILNKKGEESKATNAFVRAQLDMELDKFERAEKGLRQQIDTLRIQLSAEKMKSNDLQDKSHQANEFLAIYKEKFEQLQNEHEEVQNNQGILSENALRFEQLYREQRAKNEALLAQKQALTLKITQISEQAERRYHQDNETNQRELTYENEIRKLKVELAQAKSEALQLQNHLKSASRDAQDKSRLSGSEVARSEGGYYNSLEQNYQQERQKNKILESELATLKIRVERSNAQSQKTVSLQDALSAKNDELNDAKRKVIGFQKQAGMHEVEIREMRNELERLKNDNNSLKTKLLENGQEIRRNYESKEVQSKRVVQRMNEELATSTSELREEKRSTTRLQADLQGLKNELRRYEDIIEQGKRKESAVCEELNQLRSAYESTCEQNERLKSELKYKTSMQEGLNTQITTVQGKIFELNQKNTEIRLKMQSLENDYSELRRELGGLKIYINEIEDFANTKSPNGGWQEQRDKENLANFIQRLKKLLRTSQIAQGNTSDYRTTSNNYATQPLSDYFNKYASNEENYNQGQKFNPNFEQSSPFTLNYGQGEQVGGYKYRDYLQ